MPATIVVGGQYGSEGKGKVVTLTANRLREPWVVRCGGPNSGHTTSVNGRERILRQLPSAVSHPDATLALAAGCVIDEDVLCREILDCRLPPDRIVLDPRAVLVEDADRKAEEELIGAIGSTGSGNGQALIRRMMRSHDVRLVGSSQRLQELATIQTLAPRLHDALDRGRHVIVEGTQGFGLSLLHGQSYPYVTSKDTTAAAFASEVGLSPREIDDVVMVIRTFPIRVGGNSGEFRNETSWAEIQRASGAPQLELEYTSVTARVRRVAWFDIECVSAASRYNRPTHVAVMGLDRLDYRNRGGHDISDLTDSAIEFLRRLARELEVTARWLGTGFQTGDAIEMTAAVSDLVTNAR